MISIANAIHVYVVCFDRNNVVGHVFWFFFDAEVLKLKTGNSTVSHHLTMSRRSHKEIDEHGSEPVRRKKRVKRSTRKNSNHIHDSQQPCSQTRTKSKDVSGEEYTFGKKFSEELKKYPQLESIYIGKNSRQQDLNLSKNKRKCPTNIFKAVLESSSRKFKVPNVRVCVSSDESEKKICQCRIEDDSTTLKPITQCEALKVSISNLDNAKNHLSSLKVVINDSDVILPIFVRCTTVHNAARFCHQKAKYIKHSCLVLSWFFFFS